MRANTDSMDGTAQLLMDTAGLLYQGRMDGENATTCREPRAPLEVALAVTSFARFAQDQYNDLVGLLAALSVKLDAAGGAYAGVDEASARELDAILASGRYIPPEGR